MFSPNCRNTKPSSKYHTAIVQLLLSKYINFIRGGGHLPQNNFTITDLDKAIQKQLLEQKPQLGMNYFDYLLKKTRGTIKDKLTKLLSHEVIAVIGRGVKSEVVIDQFDDYQEIYDFLKRTNEKPDDFSNIDDIEVYDVPMDMDSVVSYYLDKDMTNAFQQYFANNVPEGIEPEEWEEMPLEQKLENDSDIASIINGALMTAQEVGIQEEAYKDLMKQLGQVDENGFWIDMNNHPWTLRIMLKNLANVYTKYDIDNNGDWLSEAVNISYKQPYNGYHDFSEEAFNERLREELPKEVLQYLPKKEHFSTWLLQRTNYDKIWLPK